MKRRSLLQGSCLVAATSVVGGQALQTLAASGFHDKPDVLNRLACTTVCFRTRFPQTRPKGFSAPGDREYSLSDIPALFAEKLHIHNIEFWSRHFAEQSPAYCSKLRRLIERAGSTLCNIQLDEPGYNLSHPEKSVRDKSVRLCKEWMDRAATCGATSMRANVGNGPRGSTFNVNTAAESFAQLAEYGRKIGVKILIENHGGYSAQVENIVALVQTVNDPWCRTLPDFGNMPGDFTQQQREAFLSKLFPWAHLVSAKGMVFDRQYRHQSYDIGRCVRLGESLGFSGVYSVEQWSRNYIPADPFRAVQAIISEVAGALIAAAADSK